MNNPMTYIQNGDYLIPDLKLSQQPEKPLGKYGRMRKTYLKEHRPILYNQMLLSEKLYQHLLEIDETAQKMCIRDREPRYHQPCRPQVHPLLHRRDAPAFEGGTDRRLYGGNLEAIQKMGRYLSLIHI